MSDKKEVFTYTYSAKKQEEVDNIRKKYLPAEEDKMERLRRLDKSVALPGTIAAVIVGIIGVMLFGWGMSLVLEFSGTQFVFGVILGVVGLAVMAAANPIYRAITKKRKEKLAPEILRLADEISQGK